MLHAFSSGAYPARTPDSAQDSERPLTPAVSIVNLCFSHDRSTPVLNSVNLTVRQGDFLALIGPNGGGKTTLLHLLLGLLTPQKGSIAVFGEPPALMSRHIGYVPQFSTMQPDFPASVLDMVLMGSASPGIWPNIRGGSWDTGVTARDKARNYLELLGLSGLEKQRVGALSGGQRQRALVARALMGSQCNLGTSPSPEAAPIPFLLLLDEPTASIDPEGKLCFYEFLGRLRGTISMIVVSHDFFMASPFFSSIAFVNTNLTPLENRDLSPENLSLLFGQHLHDCPIAYIQHAGHGRKKKKTVTPSASGDKR